jgi:hypothetical protein
MSGKIHMKALRILLFEYTQNIQDMLILFPKLKTGESHENLAYDIHFHVRIQAMQMLILGQCHSFA